MTHFDKIWTYLATPTVLLGPAAAVVDGCDSLIVVVFPSQATTIVE